MKSAHGCAVTHSGATHFFWVRLSLILFGALGLALALWLNRSQLLIGFDGGYIRDLARRQFLWDVPLTSISMDVYQGIGDIFFCAMNVTLFPSFALTAWMGQTDFAKVGVYFIVAIEMLAATACLARTLGMGRPTAVAAGLLLCLCMFPLGGPGLIYPILALVPQQGTLIAVSSLLGACFLRFGQTGVRQNWPFAVGAMSLVAFFLLASPLTLILAIPFLLICGVAGLIGVQRSGERAAKTWFVASFLLFLIASGPAAFVLGLFIDTAVFVFPGDFVNNRATILMASILFHWSMVGPVGPFLAVLAFCGAVLGIFDSSDRRTRIFAVALLTYFVSRISFWLLTYLVDFWRGPGALYFEFFVLPLYAIFAVRFIGRCLGRWGAALGAWSIPLLVGGTASAAVVLAVTGHRSNWSFPYPPAATPFTEIIASESGVPLGSNFAGRTASIMMLPDKASVGWEDLHQLDGALSAATGNEMRLVGLNHFGIPTLFQYGPTTTPAFHLVTSRLLARDEDRQTRSVQVLRRIEAPALSMLGVRFVISDLPPPVDRARLRATMQYSGQTLHLYEFDRPNLGNYSPTRSLGALDIGPAIAAMKSADFNPLESFIGAPEGIEIGPLTPATDASMSFDGVSLHVRAKAVGRSVLILPVEYSRCLDFVHAPGTGGRVFRANILQVGILFESRLEAKLTLWHGPWSNPLCRIRDLIEMREVGLGNLPAQ
ncbi:hypothetical protein [Bosea sp. R86505]|uniref:hypothetical protein n=1 Tax=Bosea sp. R86505 TaxID=3101710 RepID=UPI0036725CBF